MFFLFNLYQSSLVRVQFAVTCHYLKSLRSSGPSKCSRITCYLASNLKPNLHASLLILKADHGTTTSTEPHWTHFPLKPRVLTQAGVNSRKERGTLVLKVTRRSSRKRPGIACALSPRPYPSSSSPMAPATPAHLTYPCAPTRSYRHKPDTAGQTR